MLFHLDASYWHDLLRGRDVLSLAACNKSTFSSLSPIVSLADVAILCLLRGGGAGGEEGEGGEEGRSKLTLKV